MYLRTGWLALVLVSFSSKIENRDNQFWLGYKVWRAYVISSPIENDISTLRTLHLKQAYFQRPDELMVKEKRYMIYITSQTNS